MSTAEVTAEQYAVYLEACRQSPDLFAEHVMGFRQAPCHLTLQRMWTDHDDCYCEFPRGHGKTQQMIARVCFEIGHRPDIRVKYVQQNEKEAGKSVDQMRGIIDSRAYREVFPHVRKDKDHWTGLSFKVRTKRPQRDATVEANGVLGRAGGRYDLLVGDDVCDLKNAVQMPRVREQVKDFWATNWLAMADETAKLAPRTWKVGTCYHVSDITADWRAQHEEDGTLLRMPVVDWTSPWPEFWTEPVLRQKRKRMGPMAFGRAYLLQPLSSEMLLFPAEWLDRALYEEMTEEESRHAVCMAAMDWAFTEKRMASERSPDPDRSICLIGRHQRRNATLFVEDMVAKRCQFPEFLESAISQCTFRGVTQAKAEANGPQKGIQQQANKQAPFPILPLDRTRDKVTRAIEIQAQVESGKFRIRARKDSNGVLRPVPELQLLYDEMTVFPGGDHDDTVDAAIDLANMATAKPAPLTPTRIQSSPQPGRLYGHVNSESAAALRP